MSSVSLTPASRTVSPSTHVIPPSAAQHAWQHVAGAAITALAVGALAMTTLGFLVVVILGLGLSRLGAPHLIVWPVVAIAVLIAIALSIRLGLRVWQIERLSPPTPAAAMQSPG